MMKNGKYLILWLLCALLFTGCSGRGNGYPGNDPANSSTPPTDNSEVVDTSSADLGDCAATANTTPSNIETVVCTVNAFLDTLSTDERNTVSYDNTNAVAKTTWSDLPTDTVSRNGLRFGDLSADSLSAALTVVKAALSTSGYQDFAGVLAADDYLGSVEDSTATYSSNNYYIAIIGTPGTDTNWMLQIGGHNLAYNITYISGTGYPVPNAIGAEPKDSFESNSSTYAPLAIEGDAMQAMFEALTSSQLDFAFLDGESYSDVLVGPDNGSAAFPRTYPSVRKGVLVSDLSSDQQQLVKLAIAQWVDDFAADVADPLMETYTSDTALADTYIAWAGTKSAGVDLDVAGTYMRIDGPRLWIELLCREGTVISGKTRFSSVFRDKTVDYGNNL